MNKKHKAYITHYDSISPAGYGDELFANILCGKTALKKDDDIYKDISPTIGHIKSQYSFDENLYKLCHDVLTKSNLVNYDSTMLVVGSSVGGMPNSEQHYFTDGSYVNVRADTHGINTIAHKLKQHFSFKADISFSTACTSSANALGYAMELLQADIYDSVLVVGADELCQTTVRGFDTLGVLSKNICRPFDETRDGMNVSEAIAVVLLQNRPQSKDDIALVGVGYSSDAFHMTRPHENATGAIIAMSDAMTTANISPDDIDYINSHGTGTIANDEAEAGAIAKFFAHKPYISSTKSTTGHTLGASGAIEAIVCCEVLKAQTVPSNRHEKTIYKDINLTTQNKKADIRYAMSNSFAFGGNNCCLVFKI